MPNLDTSSALVETAAKCLATDHDGRFATVRDVIEHYDKFLRLSLSEAEKTDLAEYLLSL